MLEQSILADLDPAVLAALKEREKDYDTFNKQQDDPPAPPADANKYNFFDEEEDPYVKQPPPTQNYMGAESRGNDDPVLDELNRNAYFERDRYDRNNNGGHGEEVRSERSIALSNKSEEDTMEKRRNYVVEIIELAEELNCVKRLPDEMTMMAMPFNKLVTMWHLYDERVSRSTVMRMVRNAFAILCIATGRGVEFFLKKVLNNSFMDWSVWQNNFYAKVTTERPEHRPPFDRALQKVLNRFSSVKELMSGEGSLLVMVCVFTFKEYRRQDEARKAEEDKLQAMRKEIKMEVAAEMKQQVKDAMMEERRNYPMPPSPPPLHPLRASPSIASNHSAPEFDTQSMLSRHSWEQDEEPVESEKEHMSESYTHLENEVLEGEHPYEEYKSSPAIQEVSEVEQPETVQEQEQAESPITTQPLNGQINDPMDIDVEMKNELDELASQATSRTQQSSKKRRNKKEIVPDLVL